MLQENFTLASLPVPRPLQNDQENGTGEDGEDNLRDSEGALDITALSPEMTCRAFMQHITKQMEDLAIQGRYAEAIEYAQRYNQAIQTADPDLKAHLEELKELSQSFYDYERRFENENPEYPGNESWPLSGRVSVSGSAECFGDASLSSGFNAHVISQFPEPSPETRPSPEDPAGVSPEFTPPSPHPGPSSPAPDLPRPYPAPVFSGM